MYVLILAFDVILFICPIAIVYSQFASVRVSFCVHSHARISLRICTKIDKDVETS